MIYYGVSLKNKFMSVVPDSMKNRVTIAAPETLNCTCAEAMGIALNVIDKEIAANNMPLTVMVSIVIVQADTISLSFNSREETGTYTPLILLPAHRWENFNYTLWRIVVCILEELCHCFFGIRDEVRVNYKVTELLCKYHPEAEVTNDDSRYYFSQSK